MLVWVIVFFNEAQLFEAIDNSISVVSLAWLLNDNILKDCHVVPRFEIRLHYTHCSQFALRGVIRKCMGCLKKYIEPSPIWYFLKDPHVFLYYPSKCLHNKFILSFILTVYHYTIDMRMVFELYREHILNPFRLHYGLVLYDVIMLTSM